jgi:RecJ-like exonuclease
MSLFVDEIERIAKVFKSIARKKFVRVFSHFDCDGICSASILSTALSRENLNFSVTFLKQLTKEFLDKLEANNDVFLFLDSGSGQINFIQHIVDKTQVFILDHHLPKKFRHLNLFHLNPYLFDEEEIPTSIISYLFVKNLNKQNAELVDLSVVGAIGDEIEEGWEFKGLITRVLKEAEELGKISIVRGIRIYGRSKPIHKALAFSFDPFIPGISGSESNAVQFLAEIPLQLKVGEEFRRLKDLSLEEQKKLATAIIMERLRAKKEKSEDIFGNIYLLSGAPEDFEDAREFATILNACGRMGRPEIGLRVCVKDYSALSELQEIFTEYRKKLYEILNWVKDSLKHEGVVGYFVGRDKIPESIVGTVTSILLKSYFLDQPKILIGFAESDGKVKVSVRTNMDINLGEIITKVIEEVEGEGGGHLKAGGAFIETGKEREFVEILKGVVSGEA